VNFDDLLSRFDGIRHHGDHSAQAQCPAHQDHSASLSITEVDGGKILLHCFAGCSAIDVVRAVGLTLADLFPERIAYTSPLSAAKRREAARQTGLAAALGVLGLESKIVQIAARTVAVGKVLDADDTERLIVACQRIDAVREAMQ